ncbi:ribosome-inactivating family protein [Pseudomonas aeruginosa]|uniref:ribosome-inactivating family protein n=1 Tax=Pseudomonas aeruginosa TaxID=287 RepID=UPI001375CDFC|nr:ribosome-inactivating family protein [Pseudomonas aeruginosa]
MSYKMFVFLVLLVLCGGRAVADLSRPLMSIDFLVPHADSANVAELYLGVLRDIQDNWAPERVSNSVRGLVSSSAEVSQARDYYQLGMTFSDRSLSFYVHPANLYIVGFRVDNVYYAIRNEFVPNFGVGSVVSVVTLGFEGDYLSMERAAGTDRSRLHYGMVGLGNSLLQEMNSPSDTNAARLLLMVVPMFIEGARFIPSVGTDIANGIRNGEPGSISARDQALTTSWNALGEYYRSALNDPRTPPVNVGGTSYSTAAQVAALISIIMAKPPR